MPPCFSPPKLYLLPPLLAIQPCQLASELLSYLDSSDVLSDGNPSNYSLLQLLQIFHSYHEQIHIIHHLTASKATLLNICFSAPLLHQSQPCTHTFCCNLLIPAPNIFLCSEGKKSLQLICLLNDNKVIGLDKI